jgi:dihydrofolate synthase/folylpolyglutamate synthase
VTIDEAFAYLNSFLNYEKTPLNANLPRDFNLLRVYRLLEALGCPHERVPAVHVAGTKGKGSTCAFTERILRAAGFRTGLFTSPHLVRPTERIRVNGEPITPEALASLVTRLRPLLDTHRESEHGKLTFFEVFTTLAFQHFVEVAADVLVVEVGMGGRLDATNVLMPVVTAITAVGLDHQAALGNTLDSIAREKAGIIKPHRPLVLAPQSPTAREVIHDVARAHEAPVYEVGNAIQAERIGIREGREWCSLRGDACRLEGVGLRLLGRHQVDNAATAFGVALRLRKAGWRISDSALLEGLRSATIAGRFQIVPGPNERVVVLDCAHTTEAAWALRRTLADVFGDRPIAFVVGMSVDKNLSDFASALAPVAAEAYLTRTRENPRAADPDHLARLWRNLCPNVRIAETVSDAIAFATNRRDSERVVCVTGSVFLVGDAIQTMGLDPFHST